MSCCRIKPPIAVLKADYSNGDIVQIRADESVWNELYPNSSARFRRIRWYILKNGYIAQQIGFVALLDALDFAGALKRDPSVSNGEKLLFTAAYLDVKAFLQSKGVIVNSTDILEVVCDLKNGDGSYSDVSNRILLNAGTKSGDCCDDADTYQVLHNGVFSCLQTPSGDCYKTPNYRSPVTPP
jgi:hypothetical protein